MTSAAVPLPDLASVSCLDFLEFEDVLKRTRIVDDKIIYELNTTIPTNSFAAGVDITGCCAKLYSRLKKTHDERENAIERCVLEQQQRVTDLRAQKANNPDDLALLKELRRQQTSLRLFQAEVNVEEVIRERTLKAFYERCRTAFKPSGTAKS